MSVLPTEQIDDELWAAIGDPTRRRVIDLLLTHGSGTASSISDELPVSRQAVAKHLTVLERVALVEATPAGREKRYHVDPDQLDRAVQHLDDVRATWNRRLRRIKHIAETIERQQGTT